MGHLRSCGTPPRTASARWPTPLARTTSVPTSAFRYDTFGRAAGTDYTATNRAVYSTDRRYDSLSRLSGWDRMLPGPNSNQEDQVLTTNYTYDTIGNLTNIDGSHNGSSIGVETRS